jgi:rod shape-determining protein MreC
MKFGKILANFMDVVIVIAMMVGIYVVVQKTDVEKSVILGISQIHNVARDVFCLVGGQAVAEEEHKQNWQEEKKSLEAEVASLLYLKEENESLKSMLGIATQKNLKLVEANVVMSDIFGLRDSLMLDKGTKDGIQVGREVLSGGFLVGVVVEAREVDSKVKLISDNESKIAGVINNDTGSQGIVKSRFGNEIKFDMVPQSEKVEEGQFVMTSGLDGLTAGIPIAKIIRVNEGEFFYDIDLERSVDFYKMRKVFVLTL